MTRCSHRLARNVIIFALFFSLTGHYAWAQEERTSIRIEAEIIPGLGSGSPGGGQNPGGPASPGNPGNEGEDPEIDPDDDGQDPSDQIEDVDQVAQRLLTSAQTGDLALTDTAMVAAIQTRRSNRQNPDALVTITVIDENGNVRSTTMRSADLRPDLLSPSAGLNSLSAQAAPGQPVGGQVVLTGDVMRRTNGITYFYVQICSCGI